MSTLIYKTKPSRQKYKWLAGLKQQGPLLVQKTFYTEGKDYTHIYLLHPSSGLAGLPVFGTFIIFVPEIINNTPLRKISIEKTRAITKENETDYLVSLTSLNGMLIAHYLSKHAQKCKEIFIQIWQLLRPVSIVKQSS